MTLSPITLLVKVIFSPLASLMSYLITYDEYNKHLYSDKAMPKKLAVDVELVTFVIFMVISLIAGMFIGKMVAN